MVELSMFELNAVYSTCKKPPPQNHYISSTLIFPRTAIGTRFVIRHLRNLSTTPEPIELCVKKIKNNQEAPTI